MEKHILQEAFKALDVLEEDAFNLSDTGSMDDFSNFIKDDDDKEEISIIDPDTDSEDGLEDNYVGKVILDCAVCHSKLYFDPKDIVIDEDEELVNVGTECPYCYSVDGYKIIGEVAPYEETDDEEVEIEVKEEEDTDDDESLDESFLQKLSKVLNRLNEAEMSDEDKADTEVLKRIYDKTQKRANAKLTPEEKAVLDKYGLVRGFDKDIRKKGDTEYSYGPVLDTREIRRAMDRRKPVNLADRARKLDTRGSGYVATLPYGYNTPNDPQKGRPTVVGKYGWKTTKNKHLLDMERQAENTAMYEPVEKMKRALSDRKSATASLADMDREFQARKDAAKAEYDKKIAEIDRSKKWRTEWDTDKLSSAKSTIDTLLKRKDDRVDTEVDESLKESYRDLNDPTDWIRNFLKSHPFDTADEFIEYLDDNDEIEELEDRFQTDICGAIEEYFDELEESLKESFEKVDIETENEKMTMTADETGKVSVTTEPKEETIVPVTSDTKDEIAVANTDDNMRDVIDVDVDEFDEESFDELGESYFKKNYSNVDSYKTTKITESNNKLVVEGLIKFNSGKEKATTFIFESKDATKSGKIRFIGENQQITRGHKSFTLSGSLSNKKFIAESFNYNYRAKDNDGKSVRLYGTVRKSKINEADEHPDLTGKENSISTILMKNKSKIDSAKSKDELIKVLTDALGEKGGQKAQEVLRIAKGKKDLTAALTYVYNFILKGEHKGTISSKKRYK